MEELNKIFIDFEEEVTTLNGELEAALNDTGPLDLALEVQREGISKADVLKFEEFGIYLSSNTAPMENFTEHRSSSQLIMVGESMTRGAFNFVGNVLKTIAKIIGSIFGMIGKFIKWITGNGSSGVSAGTYSSASSAASEINVSEVKTIQNGPSILKHLPRTKQRAFFNAVKDLRTSLWQVNTVIIDPSKAILGDPVKSIPLAMKDAELRVGYSTTIMQGFNDLGAAIDKSSSVNDFFDVQDILDGLWEKLSIINYKEYPLDYKTATETDRKEIEVAKVRLTNMLKETPIDDNDFKNLPRDIDLLKEFNTVVEKLASSSAVLGWNKAVDNAVKYSKQIGVIANKLDKITDQDSLGPQDLHDLKGVFTTINTDTKVLSTLLTTHIVAFGRVIKTSKLSAHNLKTITESCKAITKHKHDKADDYEIAIDVYGKFIGKA